VLLEVVEQSRNKIITSDTKRFIVGGFTCGLNRFLRQKSEYEMSHSRRKVFTMKLENAAAAVPVVPGVRRFPGILASSRNLVLY
jgi:predicted  nucleic acid-binding Zn-ribbon protein